MTWSEWCARACPADGGAGAGCALDGNGNYGTVTCRGASGATWQAPVITPAPDGFTAWSAYCYSVCPKDVSHSHCSYDADQPTQQCIWDGVCPG